MLYMRTGCQQQHSKTAGDNQTGTIKSGCLFVCQNKCNCVSYYKANTQPISRCTHSNTSPSKPAHLLTIKTENLKKISS